MFYYGRSIAALHTYTSARVRQRTQYYYKYSGRVPASHRDFRCSLKQLKMTLKGFSIGLYVAITLLAACHSAEAARSASPARQRGTITITNTNRGTDPAMASLAGLGTPMAIDSSQAAIGTAVKTNIKRIYFKNNCTCTDGAQDTDAPYPQVALSYKPVQSADFYNIGYWKVTGCDAKYLVATTEGVMGIYAELSDNSWVWDGTKALTVYVPAQDKCVGRKKFVQYDLPLDWQDHTVYLNC